MCTVFTHFFSLTVFPSSCAKYVHSDKKSQGHLATQPYHKLSLLDSARVLRSRLASLLLKNLSSSMLLPLNFLSLNSLSYRNNRITTEGSVLLGKGLAVNESLKVLKVKETSKLTTQN